MSPSNEKLEPPKEASPEHGAYLIPAYNPGKLLPRVIEDLKSTLTKSTITDRPIIVIIDDGSTDETAKLEDSALTILRHQSNRGKGAALQTGLAWALTHNVQTVVTLDADGQHPAEEAVKLMHSKAPREALILAVRDLKKAGAPRANQCSNRFSNFMLSLMGGQGLIDTQCGLRRYPVKQTLALGTTHPGYAFESDLVLRAARKGLTIVHENSRVRYPSEDERLSYFDSVKDPFQIVMRTLLTTFTVPHFRGTRRWGRRAIYVVLAALVASHFLS